MISSFSREAEVLLQLLRLSRAEHSAKTNVVAAGRVRGNTKLHLEDYQGALEDLDKALDKTLDRQSSTKSISK